MPDPMILYPALALILPGFVAYWLGRRFRNVWPGSILGLVFLGSGIFFLSRASGASWSDGSATQYVMAAFGLSFPALISAAIGGTFAYLQDR